MHLVTARSLIVLKAALSTGVFEIPGATLNQTTVEGSLSIAHQLLRLISASPPNRSVTLNLS